MTDGERDLSLVVFGATGVTGRHLAAYLADRAEETGARWAAAGRDPAKVERVLAEIGVTAPEIVTAEVEDRAALAAMASRARVVLNVVGPFALYGEPVIAACIAAGTDYVDITGEMPFTRRMIDTYQEQAKEAGVKIVNVSGFEALPADLAVLLAAETARERWDEDLATVDLDADMLPRGRSYYLSGLSGGTLQTMAEAIGDERASLTLDPAALITEDAVADTVRRVSPIRLHPRLSARGEVIGPLFPIPFINPAVIHRTAALLAAEEGRRREPFRYREGTRIPGSAAMLPLRYAAAAALGATDAGLFRALSSARPSVRRRISAFLRRALPSSGYGPSTESMEAWTWKMEVNARTVAGRHVHVDVEGQGNPGYLTTPRMMGEAGLMLAEGKTPARTGFLTPATALGTAQLDRFQHAGLRFRLSS